MFESRSLLCNIKRRIYVNIYKLISLDSTSGYTSINPILVSILMGLRSLYPESELDTRIPFITGNLLISYKVTQ